LLRLYLPALWERIASFGDEELLEFRQREIAVLFCDLRASPRSHTAPSAVIVEVLADYHRCVGPVILERRGILERFTGDGLMVSCTTRLWPIKRDARFAWLCGYASWSPIWRPGGAGVVISSTSASE
jgi:class 3 adenylate cyclase